MLQCIYNNLKDESYGLITVPAWEYIAKQESYYELIRDHIAYYTQDTLRFLLEKNGFTVLSMKEVNRDTWEAIVQKRVPEKTVPMIKNMKALQEQISKLTDKLERENKRIAVWGASHQGLTILSSTKLGEKVQFVIDSAPFKQGLYTIGSHIRIVSPEEAFRDPPEVILIIAPGYTEEITEIIRKKGGNSIDILALRSNQLETL